MVKQDAMNVFLGLYVPHQAFTHLWDLDSDYNLHNRLLRPSLHYYYNLLYKTGAAKMAIEMEAATPAAAAGGGSERSAAEKAAPTYEEDGPQNDTLSAMHDRDREEYLIGDDDTNTLTFFPVLRLPRDAVDSTSLIEKYFINDEVIQQREALTKQLSAEMPTEFALKLKLRPSQSRGNVTSLESSQSPSFVQTEDTSVEGTSNSSTTPVDAAFNVLSPISVDFSSREHEQHEDEVLRTIDINEQVFIRFTHL